MAELRGRLIPFPLREGRADLREKATASYQDPAARASQSAMAAVICK